MTATQITTRPLAALSVEGVLFPSGPRMSLGLAHAPAGHEHATIGGLPVSYHPDLGAFLRDVADCADIIVCASWEQPMLDEIAGHFDLPWGTLRRVWHQSTGREATGEVTARAHRRPLLWIARQQRASSPQMRQWQRSRDASAATPTLIMTTHREKGLTARQMTRARSFLYAHQPPVSDSALGELLG